MEANNEMMDRSTSSEAIKLSDQDEELLFLKCSNRVKTICYTAQSISARLQTSSKRLKAFLDKLPGDFALYDKVNAKGNVPSLANWFGLLGSQMLFWEIQEIPARSIRMFKKEFENCLIFIENYLLQCEKSTSKLLKLKEKIDDFSFYLSNYKEFFEQSLNPKELVDKLDLTEKHEEKKESIPIRDLITFKFSSTGYLTICQNEKEIKITEASSLIQVGFVTICIDHIHRALNPLFCSIFSEKHSSLQELIDDLKTLKLNLKTRQKFNTEFISFTSIEKSFVSNSFKSIETEIWRFASVVDKLKVEFDKFLSFIEIIKLAFWHRKLYTNEELTLSGLIRDRESILISLTSFRTSEFNLAYEDPTTLKLLNDLINSKEDNIISPRRKNFYSLSENILRSVRSLNSQEEININAKENEEVETIKKSDFADFKTLGSDSEMNVTNPGVKENVKLELINLANLNCEDYAERIEAQVENVQNGIDNNLIEALRVLWIPTKKPQHFNGSLTIVEEISLVIFAASREFSSFKFLQKQEFEKLGESFKSLLTAIERFEKATKKYSHLHRSQLYNYVSKKTKKYEKEIVQLYGFDKTWDYDLKNVDHNHIRNLVLSRANESPSSQKLPRVLKGGEMEIRWENGLQFKATENETTERIFSYIDFALGCQWNLILLLVRKLEYLMKKATRLVKKSNEEIGNGKSLLKNLFEFMKLLDKKGIIRPEEKRETANILVAKILSTAEGVNLFEYTLKPVKSHLNRSVNRIKSHRSRVMSNNSSVSDTHLNNENPKLSQGAINLLSQIQLIVEYSTYSNQEKMMQDGFQIQNDSTFYLQRSNKPKMNLQSEEITEGKGDSIQQESSAVQNYPIVNEFDVLNPINYFSFTVIPSLEVLIQLFPKRSLEVLRSPSPSDNILSSEYSRLQALIFILGISMEKIRFYEIRSEDKREEILQIYQYLQMNAKILEKKVKSTKKKLTQISSAINSFLGHLGIKRIKGQLPENPTNTLVAPFQEIAQNIPLCTLKYEPYGELTKDPELIIQSIEAMGNVGSFEGLYFDDLDINEQIVIIKQILDECGGILFDARFYLRQYQPAFKNLKESLKIWAKSIANFKAKEKRPLTQDEIFVLKEEMAILNAAKEKTKDNLNLMKKYIQGFLNIYFVEGSIWKTQINLQGPTDFRVEDPLDPMKKDTVRRYVMYEKSLNNQSFKDLVHESLTVKIPFPTARHQERLRNYANYY